MKVCCSLPRVSAVDPMRVSVFVWLWKFGFISD